MRIWARCACWIDDAIAVKVSPVNCSPGEQTIEIGHVSTWRIPMEACQRLLVEHLPAKTEHNLRAIAKDCYKKGIASGVAIVVGYGYYDRIDPGGVGTL